MRPARSGDENSAPHFAFVEEHMLTNPPIAVQQTKREILQMAKIALDNFDIAIEIICTLDYTKVEAFRTNERQLNFLNKELAKFIVKLLKSDLSEKDRIYQAQEAELQKQIEDEKERASEIDELEEYVGTDEYVEEVAKDKLGLVNKNEIIFKAK